MAVASARSALRRWTASSERPPGSNQTWGFWTRVSAYRARLWPGGCVLPALPRFGLYPRLPLVLSRPLHTDITHLLQAFLPAVHACLASPEHQAAKSKAPSNGSPGGQT
jgi:hypothetical protein